MAVAAESSSETTAIRMVSRRRRVADGIAIPILKPENGLYK
jgi:hypothetical protein